MIFNMLLQPTKPKLHLKKRPSFGKKGELDCPNGPRYKALGNSWAVPVVTWIGERINKELKK